MKTQPLLSCVAALCLVTVVSAEDWPGWMGAQRDGVYREGGIVDAVPSDGLAIKWRTPIHGGYAGPSVADGRVYVFDFQREDGSTVDKNDLMGSNVAGKERLLVLDEATGEQLWEHTYDCYYTVSYAYGPRCTPQVDGNRVYILGSQGDLKCLSVEGGEVIWSRHLERDFNTKAPTWGYSSHPLIVGDTLYTMVGGDGQAVVAFDKMTGETLWKALDANPGYAPPTLVNFGGVDQVVVFHAKAIAGLNPTNGSVYWEVPFKTYADMAICRPMIEGDRMFITANTGSLMLQLATESPDVKELWAGERGVSGIQAANATPMFVNGMLYGTDHQDGRLIAASAENGERVWQTFDATKPGEKRFVKEGTAFLTRIGETDQYLVFSENGDFLLATLTADGYQEQGRMHVLEPTQFAKGHDVVWSHPAYANRTAYIRNDQEIVAVDLAK